MPACQYHLKIKDENRTLREQLQRLQKEVPRQPRGKENPTAGGAPMRHPTIDNCGGVDGETVAHLHAKMQVQDAEKVVLQQELALAFRALNLTSPPEPGQESMPPRGAARTSGMSADAPATLTQLLDLVGETKRLKRVAELAQQSNKDHERIIWALRQELALHTCKDSAS